MKQILQNLGSGETMLAEVPAPCVRPGHLLIATRTTLVSAGTEKMLVSFGRASLLEKARQQPEKVQQVLRKVKTDGLWATLDAVRAKLDQPLALGYCNAGTVLEVGAGVEGFARGDVVACNGPHAEIVCVPKNLCAKVPAGVSADAASFTVVGAIGLQGIRLLEPAVGETYVVTGLGLIGLLSVQILLANGCRVLGIDMDSSRCALARSFGAETCELGRGEDPVIAAETLTRGRGVDGVLVTASTPSDEPLNQAAQMCRQRGKVVLVGVTGMQLRRDLFYKKEISFQVSCSYGPGRYDPTYEEAGNDYPYGLVRWTEQRNFEAILDLMARGRIQTEPLVTNRVPFDVATEAYEGLLKGSSLGILLQYKGAEGAPRAASVALAAKAGKATGAVVGVLGAGNFAGQVLLPALAATGARLKRIVSAQGVTATHVGKKLGFEEAATDSQSVLNDAEIDAMIVATRHASHAKYVLSGLRAGKKVFVEKPLCLTLEELGAIEEAYNQQRAPFLMVGFNRRFAPQVVKMKAALAAVPGPKTFLYTVNAGRIPASHWAQAASEGGRIVGEACHFIDLLRFLAGCPIVRFSAEGFSPPDGAPVDTATVLLGFGDGSHGVVQYLSNSSKELPKEKVEVHAQGRSLVLDNYRDLRGYSWPKFSRVKLSRLDKGHRAEMAAFVEAVKSGAPCPIPAAEVFEVSRVAIEVARLLERPAGGANRNVGS